MLNLFIYSKFWRITPRFLKFYSSPSSSPFLQLLRDISQKQRDSRQQKQVDLRRAYITARFTPATLPAFFTLGDQLDYGGFENRALEPGQEYVFFILAELNSTTGVQMSLHYITPPPVFTSAPSFLFSCRLSLDIVIHLATLLKQYNSHQSKGYKQIQ